MTRYASSAAGATPGTPAAAQHAWGELLRHAVATPGLMHRAYNAFHNYSVGNQLLALVQCEERGITPGPIATYQGWLEKGRQVQRGERALILCMPLKRKLRADAAAEAVEVISAFVYKPRWFVLAQTEGAELPPPELPTWDKTRALAALDVCEIPFDELDGNCQGFARKRQIAVSPVAALPYKTTFHELAHVILGHTAELDFNDGALTPKNLREAEAEAVALICCESLGLPGAEFARGYIQHWLSGEVIPEKSAQKIFGAADRILKAGAPVVEVQA